MKPTRINVTSEHSTYSVVIGAGITRDVAPLLEATGVNRQRLLVTSPPIWRLHGGRVRPVIGRQDRPAFMAVGERAKTLATVETLYGACVKRGLDRSATLIALGGGVVGDVAGFAAATYLRGVRLVQIPTTLLAQVDSAIGGKVGVNLPAGKNLVGSFYPPALVICDPEVLDTLPRREFRAGLYEVVKYGVISSRRLFTKLRTQLPAILAHDPAVLSAIVSECCRIKAEVVMSDERESGPRRALNFGHTVGHALEAITRYERFRHGEAVGYGMLAAARLSVLRGLLSSDDEQQLSGLLKAMGKLPPVGDLRIREALDVMAHDKKVVNGRLHFVLASGIGSTQVVNDVHPRELVRVMRSLGMKD